MYTVEKVVFKKVVDFGELISIAAIKLIYKGKWVISQINPDDSITFDKNSTCSNFMIAINLISQ